MSERAFTLGYAEAYDAGLAAATEPEYKAGARLGYDGGWVWPTAVGALQFLASELFPRDPTGYAVYELELPSGWADDVSRAPHPVDGVFRLLHDARIVGRVP